MHFSTRTMTGFTGPGKGPRNPLPQKLFKPQGHQEPTRQVTSGQVTEQMHVAHKSEKTLYVTSKC